jgi:predicted RNA polymerase sigma factor
MVVLLQLEWVLTHRASLSRHNLVERESANSTSREKKSEAVGRIVTSLASPPIEPYTIQAALAAIQAGAPTPQDTDWK